ncbi:MAG: TonB-dependent receptor [Bacteroidales bacterium]|nr:TonB-dependent receptor [Bacteroidales bacterium]MCF8389574.1 TonB-dependent receptor [Bacteroidales bacterium]
MRIALLLLLINVSHIFAGNLYSQTGKLTLNLRDKTLSEILNQIENQTDFTFLYNSEILDLNRKTDIRVKDEQINNILNKLFKNTNIKYVVYNKQIILSNNEIISGLKSETQPTILISGTVTDENGDPMIGATVVIKGTTQGAITDVGGRYELNALPGAAFLVFTYVGYISKEIAIEGRTDISVSLAQELLGLDEVVVVGYGTMKKRDITGSVVSINEESLSLRPNTNLEQMLQGSAAGLSINVNGNNAEGTKNTMLIRGQNSITASNNPLIILDGVPFEGQLSEINPNDISSLEVLKDASSSAIYGARGANGVILISTKKGIDGKMVTSYDGYFGIEQMINIPLLLDGKTFYELKQKRGLVTTPIEDEGYESGRDTDWLGIATQPGNRQQHNLSIRGGNKQTNYFISTSYNSVKGVAVNDKFERYLFRINLNHKLTDWLTFGTNTQYGYYDRSGIEAEFVWTYEMNPLAIPYYEDGSIRMYTWEDATYSVNPLDYTLRDNSDITRRFFTNNFFLVDLPFLDGLSFKFNTGYDFNSNLYQEYRGRDTYDGIRRGGQLSNRNNYDENWLIENILSYKADIGMHRLFLTALYSAQNEWNHSERINAEGFPNDAMSYYQAAEALLREPSSSYSENAHISQMLRANYSFDSRYLLTLTARRDGYSAFGKERKFGLFPSFALGWNIANERFMKNIDPIEALKFRISFGINGNEAISPYSTLPNLSTIFYIDVNDNPLVGFYPNKLGDPTLGWETTKSLNMGLDFNLFKNRIIGLLDLYSSNTTDLLLSKSISSVNGVKSIVENIGETKNMGIEFQLSSFNISKKDFIWKTDFNISHYQNEIVQVGLTDEEGNYIDDIGNKWFIGSPINVYYDYVFDGIWQETNLNTPQGPVRAGDIRVKDTNGDGVISTSDKKIQGKQIPDFVAGMTNTFKYKNWSFSFFLNSIYGIEKKNPFLDTGDSDFRKNRYPVNYWTTENPNNDYPRLDESSRTNSYGISFLRDASFLRLQELTLSYTFSEKILPSSKTGISNLEVYANFKNLFTLTKWTAMDPEFNDQYERPQTAIYQFGIRFSL